MHSNSLIIGHNRSMDPSSIFFLLALTMAHLQVSSNPIHPNPQMCDRTRTPDQTSAHAAAAPRGALLYPWFSWEGLEGRFLGLMAYLDGKPEGDNSMPGRRRSCPGDRVC